MTGNLTSPHIYMCTCVWVFGCVWGAHLITMLAGNCTVMLPSSVMVFTGVQSPFIFVFTHLLRVAQLRQISSVGVGMVLTYVVSWDGTSWPCPCTSFYFNFNF